MSFGLIPAAGHSRRMGQHKLLMPWGDQLVIDAVLDAWTSSVVDRVLVIARRDDEALLQRCRRWPVELLALQTDTPDMKQTIQRGWSFVANHWRPNPPDCCLIAPADLPKLKATILNQVVDAAANHANEVVLPQFGDKQGHPVGIPWHMTPQLFDIPADKGLDHWIAKSSVFKLSIVEVDRPRDIDTFEDYQRELGSGSDTG